MKNPILFLLAFFVFACSEKSNDTNQRQDSLATDATKTTSAIQPDTIMLGNYILYLSPIEESVYNKYPAAYSIEKESTLLSKDASSVKRIKDTLIFTLPNAKTAILVNEPNGEADGYGMYSYIKNIPDINQWLVSGMYNEYYNYLLINQYSGDTTAMCGVPVVASNNKMVICGNSDLIAAFTFNGLELYNYEDKKLIKIASKELSGWGVNELKWINDSTLLFKQEFVDSTMSSFKKYSQAKIRQ